MRMDARRSFAPLFLSLLASPLFAAACGDVAAVDGARDRDGSAPPDARSDVDAPDADAPDADLPDGPIITFPPCVSGTVADEAKWCCDATSAPNCGASNSGDTCVIDCQRVCTALTGANDAFSCFRSADADGGATIQYLCGACGVGRIPAGLAACDEGGTVGERLAFQAYYEAASVFAFDDLAAALRRLATVAPVALVALIARIEQAAREERVHAATMSALAARYGAAVRAPEAPPSTARTLLDFARENAIEGCVRETYGALVAAHQARFAGRADLRAAFAAIAADEASHAALSWDLHDFFGRLLGPAVAAELDAAREAAFAAFAEDASNRPESFVDRVLGVPRGPRAVALLAALRGSLAA